MYCTCIFPQILSLTYLLAVICGILHTDQVRVGPTVQVSVLAANVTVSSKSRLALAAEHGVGEVPQVVASGVLVAVVATVQTGVAWCANL